MKHSMVLAGLGVLVGLAGQAAAQVGQAGGAEGFAVEVRTDWPTQLDGGYYPVRVSARNHRNQARPFTVRVEGDRSGSVRQATRTVELAPGASARFSVLFPIASQDSSFNVSCSSGGREIGGRQFVNVENPNATAYRSGATSSESLAMLVIGSADQARAVRSVVQANLTPSVSSGYSSYTVSVDVDEMVTHIAEAGWLPESWLAYTSLDAVAADRESLRLMESGEPARRAELLKWVSAGGALIVAHTPASQASAEARALLGEGAIQTLAPAESLLICGHGLGQLIFAEPGLAGLGDENGGSALMRSLRGRGLGLGAKRRVGFSSAVDPPGRDRYYYGRDREDNSAMLAGFKIPGVGEVPVAAFVVVMLLFVIAVGPVNYIILQRRKRLHWLPLTVPLIALTATGLVVLYAFLSEGLGIQGRSASFTWLDGSRHEAVTVTRQALYAGLAPGEFDLGGEVALLPISPGATRSRDVDWSDGQRLGRGWLPSRTEVQWATVAVEPARQRLIVRHQAGRYRAVNGLGADIAWVRLKLADGTVLEAKGVADGASADLAVVPGARQLEAEMLRSVDATKLELTRRVRLRAGLFMAEVDRALFAHGGPNDIEQQAESHVVAGPFDVTEVE